MRFDARLRAAAVPFSLRTVGKASQIELHNSSYKRSRHKLTHNRQHSFQTVSIAYLVHPRKLGQSGTQLPGPGMVLRQPVRVEAARGKQWLSQPKGVHEEHGSACRQPIHNKWMLQVPTPG